MHGGLGKRKGAGQGVGMGKRGNCRECERQSIKGNVVREK